MNSPEWTDAHGNALPRGADGIQEFALLSSDTRLAHLQLRPPESLQVDAAFVEGSERLRLVRNDAGRFAFPNEPGASRRGEFGNASGILEAVLESEGRKVGDVPLRVLAANFTTEEYSRMLRDIARVAVASLSLVHVKSSARRLHRHEVGETIGVLAKPSEPLVDALREFVSKAEAAIPTIESRPLRTMTRQTRMTPLHKAARNAAGARRVATRLDRRHVMSESLEEHLDSTENRHVTWMLKRFALPLVHALRAAEPELPPIDDAHEREVKGLISGGRGEGKGQGRVDGPDEGARREAFDGWLVGRNAELDGMAEKMQRWLAIAPLKASQNVTVAPPPTSRMMGTPGYREVFDAFHELAGDDVERWRRGLEVSEAIVNHEVHATWRCYEYWCLSQLVETFMTVARFDRRGELAFADIVEIIGGELHIRPASTLTLHRTSPEGGLGVTIRYQTRVSSKRNEKGEWVVGKAGSELVPDFLISIARHGHPADPLRFVFDAKYRDYGKQGPAAVFGDLVTTALIKYRDGLSREGREIRGSFILHSDPTPRDRSRNGKSTPCVDFWGGMEAQRWLTEHARARRWHEPQVGEAVEEAPGHTCGLIRLRPDDDRLVQLGRMVDMLLLYHMASHHPDSYCPSCSRCGSAVRAFEKESLDLGRKRRPSILYQCSNSLCSHAWFHNECTHCGTAFIKMGGRSFHERSRNKGWSHGGMYICPNCHDDRRPDTAGGVHGVAREATREDWDSLPPPDDPDHASRPGAHRGRAASSGHAGHPRSADLAEGSPAAAPKHDRARMRSAPSGASRAASTPDARGSLPKVASGVSTASLEERERIRRKLFGD